MERKRPLGGAASLFPIAVEQRIEMVHLPVSEVGTAGAASCEEVDDVIEEQRAVKIKTRSGKEAILEIKLLPSEE